LLVNSGGGGVLLFPHQQACQAVQSLGTARIDAQCIAILACGQVELIGGKSLRGLAHGVPEPRGGQRLPDHGGVVAILHGLGQVTDRRAKVFLLHAQEAHARRNPPILRVLIQQRVEELFRFIEMVRIQRGESGALGRRARDAGVHLRQFDLILLQGAGNLRVRGMRFQIIAQLRGRGRIGRVPDQRLPQCDLGVGVVGVPLQNPNAVGARSGVVRQHGAQRDGEARIAGVAIGHGAHALEGLFLAAGGAVERLIIGEADVPIRRMVAI